MNIAMYLRKSRAEESTDTIDETLRQHKEALTKFANLHQMIILNTYEEVVSGESLYARPKMLELLECVGNGDYDAVLCMDIDRLGRGGMKDQGIILDAFKNSSTLIITPDRTYDLNNDLDEELTELKTFISRRELKLITKRLRLGISRTLEDGGYIANAPYGYKKVTINKLPSLSPIEYEAQFVKMIYNMYISGKGCLAIASIINLLGAKPRRGNKFSKSTVNAILRNPVYIGKIVWNRNKLIKNGGHIKKQAMDNWTVHEGIHKPIIPVEVFDKAQEILKSRFITSSKSGSAVVNTLAGLVICSNCGNKMQLIGVHKKKARIVCNNKGCIASANMEYVMEAVMEAIHDKLSNIEITTDKEVFNKSEVYKNAAAGIKNKLDTLAQQFSRLRDLLETGVYTADIYKERVISLNERKLLLENQKSELEEKMTCNSQYKSNEISNLLDLYTISTPQEQNFLLKSIISTIIYDKKKKSAPHEFNLMITFF